MFCSETAKDSSAGVGTRAEAAKDAVGDKATEAKHSVCFSSLSWILSIVLIVAFRPRDILQCLVRRDWFEEIPKLPVALCWLSISRFHM